VASLPKILIKDLQFVIEDKRGMHENPTFFIRLFLRLLKNFVNSISEAFPKQNNG